MKSITKIYFVLLMVFFSSSAIASVSLQEKVLIDSPFIKLGNIFSGLPQEIAEKNIGKSPEPGEKNVLRLSTIERIAARFNIDWKPSPTVKSVTINRASRKISSSDFIDIITKELKKNNNFQDYIINISKKDFLVYVPVNSSFKIEVINFNFDNDSDRFFTNIKISGNDFIPVITSINGFARSVIKVPVLAKKLKKGQVINNSHIHWIKIAENRMNDNYIIHLDEIIGMQTNRSLNKGKPIKRIELRNVRLVEKGKPVTIIVQSGLMKIKTIGQALQNGSKGEFVRILNLRSKKTISGIVVAENEVRIPLNNNISFLSK